MKKHPDYSKATNAAYQLLAKQQKLSLSADVFFIAENFLNNCVLITYGQASIVYGIDRQLLLGFSEFGFSIFHDDKRIILYNEDISLGTIRFTIAHEIGHAILGHTNDHDDCFEKEANCFARNLLCPIHVAVELGLNTIQEYMDAFNITKKMAEVALDKQQCDWYHIDRENYITLSERLTAYMLNFSTWDEYYNYLVS